MPISALVRTVDNKLGVIYQYPSAPVTFTSSSGETTLLEVDGSGLPDGVLPDPWCVKYRIPDVQQNNPYNYNEDFLKAPIMDVFPQYSDDTVAWTTFDKWNIIPREDQVGRAQYSLASKIGRVPRYLRVVGKLYAGQFSDSTATIVMGLENYGL